MVYLPPCEKLSKKSLQDDSVYILDNGRHLFLWIGPHLSSDYIADIFGPDAEEKVPVHQWRVTEDYLDDVNHPATKILTLIAQLRCVPC